MTPLLADQLEQLRSQLEQDLARHLRSVKLSSEAAKPVELDQTAVGRLSRMDSLQNQSMTRSLHEREQARVAGIQEALQRMDEGVYGRCGECDSEIPFGRLLVVPEASTCTQCG